MEHIDCGRLIKQINNTLKKHADQSMCELDLTMTQAGTLLILEKSEGKRLTLKQLEKELQVAQSTSAGIVSRLEQKGLVESFGDSEDKRIKVVRLTPKGEEKCRIAEEDIANTEEALLSCLTAKEKQLFYHLLKRVRDNLK